MTELALASDLTSKLDAMRDAIGKASETTDRNLLSITNELSAAKARRDERVKAAYAEIALAEREFDDALSEAHTVIATVRQCFAPAKPGKPQLVKSA